MKYCMKYSVIHEWILPAISELVSACWEVCLLFPALGAISLRLGELGKTPFALWKPNLWCYEQIPDSLVQVELWFYCIGHKIAGKTIFSSIFLLIFFVNNPNLKSQVYLQFGKKIAGFTGSGDLCYRYFFCQFVSILNNNKNIGVKKGDSQKVFSRKHFSLLLLWKFFSKILGSILK